MRFHRNVPWNTKAFYVLKKKKSQRLNSFYEPGDDTFENVCCFSGSVAWITLNINRVTTKWISGKWVTGNFYEMINKMTYYIRKNKYGKKKITFNSPMIWSWELKIIFDEEFVHTWLFGSWCFTRVLLLGWRWAVYQLTGNDAFVEYTCVEELGVLQPTKQRYFPGAFTSHLRVSTVHLWSW